MLHSLGHPKGIFRTTIIRAFLSSARPPSNTVDNGARVRPHTIPRFCVLLNHHKTRCQGDRCGVYIEEKEEYVLMSYRALKDSVSPQSLMFYWSKHHSFEDYRVGWMVLCYPLDAAYVRKLRPVEHPLVGPTEGRTAYYGAFNQFTGSCIAVGVSLAEVCALAYLKNRTPVLVH